MNTNEDLLPVDQRREDQYPSRDARVWQDSLEKVRIVSSGPYTITSDDDLIVATAAFNITLPPVANKRKVTIIKTSGTTANTVTAPDSKTINGAVSYLVTGLYQPVTFKSDGNTYYVISGLQSGSQIVTATASAALTLRSTGTGNVVTFQDVGGDTTPTVINQDGKIVNGHTSWESEWYSTGIISNMWTVNQTTNSAGYGVVNYGGAAGLLLMRSEGAAIGDRGLVPNGTRVGQISFCIDDGVSAGYIPCAAVYATTDAATGTNDSPGRLMFCTTPDGSNTVVERMRIDKDGLVRVYGDLQVDGNIRGSSGKMYFFAGF